MNEKWFLYNVADVEKKLKTNAASGLSPKAARSRMRKANSTYFIRSNKRISTIVGEIMADFALVLLIIASVVALCFTEYTTGVTLTLIVLLNLIACVFLSYRAQRLFESLAAFFRPSATVIRSGKAFSVDPERVVVGDVVLIREGDILCFDARLVTSDNLGLMVKVDREREVEAEKLAEGAVRENERDISNMVNMVHAGSRVISGGARAIVTAVGRYTYYGALTGGLRLPPLREIPHGLKLLKKYCVSFGMTVTVALLPFSILSLLFSKGDVTLMTTFTAALAIAASSMGQLALTVCRIFFERQAKLCLSGKNPAVLRSTETMDKLVSCEYLFLLDGSAVSDGAFHFHKAICAEGELRSFNAMSGSMTAFAELVALYNSAESKTLTTGIHTPGRFRGALSEFVEKTRIDSEALKIRCSIGGYVPGNSADKTDKLFYTDMGKRYILNVSQSRAAIEKCGRAYLGNGISAITKEGNDGIASAYDKHKVRGERALVFTLSEDEFSENDIFAGMLIIGENADASFKSAIAGMKSLGVKTVSFVSQEADDDYEHWRVSAPVVGMTASISDFENNKLPVTYKFGDIDTYRGLSSEQIGKLIAHVHSMKKKVAVLCFFDVCSEFAEKPDVFITCSELQYRFSGRFEEEIEAIEVPGSAESIFCRQDVKSDADVIIPRPRDGGGGLASLRRAFALSGAAYTNLAGFFRYVLCSQFIRIFMVMLPMLFGEAFLDARHALFCGFIIDIIVMLIFVTEKCGVENARSFKGLLGEFRTPIRNNAGMIIAAAAGGLCAVLLPNLIGAIGFMGQYFYETEYLFISMILLHVTVMYCIRIDNLRRFGVADINKVGIVLCAFALLFIFSCFTIEPIGIFFDVLEITFPYLLLTVVPSAVCAILYFIIGNFRLHTEE